MLAESSSTLVLPRFWVVSSTSETWVALVGTQAVGVQRRGQDVDRRGTAGKARNSQLGGLPRKGHGIAGILPGTDGLVGGLGQVACRNTHRAGQVRNLFFQLPNGHFGGIGNGSHLGNRRLKGAALGKGGLQHLADARRRQGSCPLRRSGSCQALPAVAPAAVTSPPSASLILPPMPVAEGMIST